MKQSEILYRLGKIVVEHAPLFIMPPPANACWVDGDKCPYGLPNGRFQDRPIQICHLGGCKKLVVVKEMADEYIESELADRTDVAIDAMIEKEQVDLSSELRVIAKEDVEEELEAKILELIADFLERNDHDKKIIRVNDI
ncbi:MAG: hypothetical protein Q7K65_02130 [Candidatus Buchananbacteria bacterium]|nr:hypothetical protein [Candidatus Buchananbacteria bacterium]